jgi:hypothetical protein
MDLVFQTFAEHPFSCCASRTLKRDEQSARFLLDQRMRPLACVPTKERGPRKTVGQTALAGSADTRGGLKL